MDDPWPHINACIDLRHALAQLTPKQRAAAILYALSFSRPEIAQILQCNQTTAQRRLHKAIQNLRQFMQ